LLFRLRLRLPIGAFPTNELAKGKYVDYVAMIVKTLIILI